MIALLTALEFFCGSLMFSFWLGLAAKKDIRVEGDGNPGAFNLWHAAGFRLGMLGILLDFLKGYLPLVFLVRSGAVTGMALVPVAFAPILGHAFSPFVKFRGGKSIAVTFGVWSAVSSFEVSFAFAVILAVLAAASKVVGRGKPTSTDTDGFMAVFGMLILGAYLYVRAYPVPFLFLWLLNLVLFGYVNRVKLNRVLKTVSGKIAEKIG